MRGRKPKPTALKALAGNPGKRPLNDKEPKPENVRPRRPRWLSERAGKVWNAVARELHELGVLTRLDLYALAVWCEAVARWQIAEEHLREEGYISVTPKGFEMQSPWVGIANTAAERVRKLGAEFGMTPSSRSRIQVDVGEKELSLADELFRAVEEAKRE